MHSISSIPSLRFAVLLSLTFGIGSLGCGSSSSVTTGPSPTKCGVSLSAPTPLIGGTGGFATVSVTTQPECQWTATTEANWIAELSPVEGQGSGDIGFRVMPNPLTSPRAGDLNVNGTRFRIQQAAPCQFTLDINEVSLEATGGTQNVTVATNSACAWTASTQETWISLSTTNGTGGGQITVIVSSNTGADRSGTVSIAGQTFAVNQRGAAAACSYTITPLTQNVPTSGGAGTPLAVQTAAGCTWTATTTESWITIQTASGIGNGNGMVTFTVSANTGPTRAGVIAVNQERAVINQPAVSSCTSATIAPVSQSFEPAGGTGNPITVTTSGSCTWVATSTVPWISIVEGGTGTGNGTVRFSVAVNAGPQRSGTIGIAGQTFTVTQASATVAPPTPNPCPYTLEPASQSVAAAGGTPTAVTVTTGEGCPWQAITETPWITITNPGLRAGSGTVAYTVAANETLSQRTGSLTIANRPFTVTQAAHSCSFALNSTNYSTAASGATGVSVNVSASVSACGWTATSTASWISVTSGASGTGNGTTVFSVAANTGPARTGTLTIGNSTFTVSQANGCTYPVNPTSHSAPASGGNTNPISVTTGAGCTWSASGNVPWITVSGAANGSGSGTVTLVIAGNPGGARTGTATIANQTFTVSQASCGFSISPTSSSPAAGGLSGASVSVTAASGCAWNSGTNASWITITSGLTGTGNGTVTYNVAANTGPARSAEMTIATRTFTVNQATGCSYAISPRTQTFTATGGTGAISVTAGGQCPWTAVSNDAWITITSGVPSTGNGKVSFTVAPKGGGPPRAGTIFIAGDTFTVTQN